MLDSTEFDYEFMLKSYSVQDIALDQSIKHKTENYSSYEKVLQAYKDVKKEFSLLDSERLTVCGDFVEKLNIQNSFNKLQTIPNSKITTIQDRLLEIYQKKTKESDDFVKKITNVVNKIQNLDNEFDEYEITKNTNDCNQQIQLAKNETTKKENLYEQIKNYESNNKCEIAQKLEKVWNYKLVSLDDMKLEILKNEQHLNLINKNTVFLKQRNLELKKQYAFFNN